MFTYCVFYTLRASDTACLVHCCRSAWATKTFICCRCCCYCRCYCRWCCYCWCMLVPMRWATNSHLASVRSLLTTLRRKKGRPLSTLTDASSPRGRRPHTVHHGRDGSICGGIICGGIMCGGIICGGIICGGAIRGGVVCGGGACGGVCGGGW